MRSLVLWLVVGGLGCGGGGGSVSGDIGSSATLDARNGTVSDMSAPDSSEPNVPDAIRGSCEASERVGAFEVVLDETYSYASGEVADGVVPSTVPIELETSGSCRMLQKNNLFCDPSCSAGQTCGNDGSCIAYPESQSVGTVTIAGLDAPVSMEPVAGSFQYFDTSLPHPAFQPGAAIALSAQGGAHDPFDLIGVGVEALEGGNPHWRVVPGVPLTVEWTAGTVAEARVFATLNVDQHGFTPVTIVCESADTGSLEIPVALIDRLLGMGISGFPSGRVTRASVDSVSTSLGCIELAVKSARVQIVTLE